MLGGWGGIQDKSKSVFLLQALAKQHSLTKEQYYSQLMLAVHKERHSDRYGDCDACAQTAGDGGAIAKCAPKGKKKFFFYQDLLGKRHHIDPWGGLMAVFELVMYLQPGQSGSIPSTV